MNKIEVKVLNPEVVKDIEKMMVCAARLTQKGHAIKTMDDFVNLYNSSYKDSTAKIMANLPHPTIQKLGGLIIIVLNGASRRALAQLTRHQNEIKFCSASCQYSDWSDDANFVIPYEFLDDEKNKTEYLESCKQAAKTYKDIMDREHAKPKEEQIDSMNDAAGYVLGQGMRNTLIMSATAFQWHHMISQRTCRRNTPEVRFILLKIWEELYKLNSTLFGQQCGPFCMNGPCKEGRMSCGQPMNKEKTPTDFLHEDYPLIYKDQEN